MSEFIDLNKAKTNFRKMDLIMKLWSRGGKFQADAKGVARHLNISVSSVYYYLRKGHAECASYRNGKRTSSCYD